MVQATHGAAVLQLHDVVHGPFRKLIRAGFIADVRCYLYIPCLWMLCTC